MSSMFFWSVFGYLCGSIPFAVILGRFFVRRDPRTVGDGNPGVTNVWIAGGWKVGLLATCVEILKGWLPVWLARQAGLAGWSLVPVCLAPVLGHATMPFLKFKGGKALGATGGAWIGIIGLWAFPVYAAGALPMLALQVEHTYAALTGMLALLAYAIVVDGSDWMAALALINNLLILWTHRKSLGRPFQLRGWVINLFARRNA